MRVINCKKLYRSRFFGPNEVPEFVRTLHCIIQAGINDTRFKDVLWQLFFRFLEALAGKAEFDI